MVNVKDPVVNLPKGFGQGNIKLAMGSVACSSGKATITTEFNTVVSVSLVATAVTSGDYAFADVASISGGSVSIEAFEAAAGTAPAVGTTNTVYYIIAGY